MNTIMVKIFNLFFFLSLPFLLGTSNQLSSGSQFRLSNYTLFTVGDKLFVDLFFEQNNETFQFKLLKISDPIGLLKEMGGNNRNYDFDIWSKNGGHLLKFTKEIKSWSETFSKTTRWNSQRIELGEAVETGIFVLQAIRGEEVAYCPVVVSNSVLVFKSAEKEILAFVSNMKSGLFATESKITVYQDGIVINKSTNGREGVHKIHLDTSKVKNENLNIVAELQDEVIFSNPYIFFNDYNPHKYLGYVYTNQPVYRPGGKVEFKAIIRKVVGGALLPSENQKYNVVVRSPRNKEILNREFTTNEFGSLWSSVILDSEADIGNYTINISRESEYYNGTFWVEEYKKPEFKVEISTIKKNFTQKDILTGKVNADYYFGSPVANGNVSVKIYKSRFWMPWWYWSEYNWFYKSFASERYSQSIQREFVNEINGKLDERGNFDFEYSLNESEEFDFNYFIVAEVTDESRRLISGSTEVLITRGEFALSAFSDKYYVRKGEIINLNLKSYDFSNSAVRTDFELLINKTEYVNNRYIEKTVKTIKGKTDTLGRSSFSYNPNESGSYNYTYISYDKQKNKITASNSFFVTEKDKPFYFLNQSGEEIILDKEAYEYGDTVSAIINLSHENVDHLLTYEANSKIISHEKLNAPQKGVEIKKIINEEMNSTFTISIVYVKDKNVFSTEKVVPIIPKRQLLNVEIFPNKETFKPKEAAEYLVKVKDSRGRSVKNVELSLGVVDESIYAIRNESVSSISDFMFSPKHNYVPFHSSLLNNNFSSASRKTTLLDKNYFRKKSVRSDKSELSGKIVDGKTTKDIRRKVSLILSNESDVFAIETDSLGKFYKKEISSGGYDILLFNENGSVNYLERIVLKKDKNYIELKIDESEIIQNDFAFRREPAIFLGRGAVQELSVASDVKSKSESTSNEFTVPEIRSNFIDAPFWQPNLVTDENGEAIAKFRFPDNLTTWRTTVRGVAKVTSAGESVNKVIARKNLLVRMETPRFLREGDNHFITTTVHNYLNEQKLVRLKFNPDELKLISSSKSEDVTKIDENTIEFQLQSNQSKKIDWQIEVTKPIGEVELYAEALTDEESDAVKITLPVYPDGIRNLVSLNKIIETDQKTEIEFDIPEGIDLRTVSLSFLTQPTIAGPILKSLDDLIQYPYGCVEQTMSRFLPAIIVSKTFSELKIPISSQKVNELPKIVDAGLKRLYSFSHSDGGWGWWKNDKSDLYMTAYVLNGLLEAKSAGYQIEPIYINNSTEFLWNQLKDLSSVDKTTFSFIMYTICKNEEFVKANKNELLKMLEQLSINRLDAYSLSLLGLTYSALSEKNKSEEIVNHLLKKIIETERTAYWKEYSNRYGWQYDEVQTTAYALKLLIHVKPQSNLIQKIVTKLIEQQKGFSWNSTQQTSKVLFALIDYLKISNELRADYKGSMWLNGNEIEKFKFSKENLFDEKSKTVIDNKLRVNLTHGKNKIVIHKTGNGKIYFSGLTKYYQKEKKNKFHNHFGITKEVHKLEPDAVRNKIIYRKKKFDNVNSGDILFVKVKVKFLDEDDRYIMIEDFLPAGFEVIKEENLYSIENENFYNQEKEYGVIGRRPWIWRYSDKEIRDEKISFFVTQPEKEMEFTYLIRAQIPGGYKFPASEVSLMYYPEIMETGSTSKLIVEE